ncbi:MAG: hypothetical protein BroJett033_7840 [Chloroflexota bacterium]|nr:MAG: hypothetical protein BroJett033_7840 [Chloroflexota bacterium]
MTSANGEKPVFDFGRVSRRWNQAFAASIAKATRATIAMQRPLCAGMTNEQVQAHYDAQEAAVDLLETLGAEQSALVAEVLVSVPDGWLVKGAPAELDWSDPESLDWIRADKYQQLLQMLQTGEAYTTDAKN